MKINESTQVGNFFVEVELTLSDEGMSVDAVALATKGVRWLMQRKQGVDTILGGTTVEKSAKGKEKITRKSGWTRNDCPFSEGKADLLKAAFQTLDFPDDDERESLKCSEVSVTEYVREAVDSKFTDERAIVLNHESSLNDLEVWLKGKVGYEGETHGEDGEYAVGMLRAVRGYKLKILRERMQTI